MNWFSTYIVKPFIGMLWVLYFGVGAYISAFGCWDFLSTLSEYSGWEAFGRGFVGILSGLLALSVLYIAGGTVSEVYMIEEEE